MDTRSLMVIGAQVAEVNIYRRAINALGLKAEVFDSFSSALNLIRSEQCPATIFIDLDGLGSRSLTLALEFSSLLDLNGGLVLCSAHANLEIWQDAFRAKWAIRKPFDENDLRELLALVLEETTLEALGSRRNFVDDTAKKHFHRKPDLDEKDF